VGRTCRSTHRADSGSLLSVTVSGQNIEAPLVYGAHGGTVIIVCGSVFALAGLLSRRRRTFVSRWEDFRRYKSCKSQISPISSVPATSRMAASLLTFDRFLGSETGFDGQMRPARF
jgi:hypothetical protein